mmetsp:Transcript_20566/g.61901  ORF Transcript_20566/g.61901 Transcript_20566/m.61901 type:complete len:518 (+) Transcript_20566:140-1693(+)
MAVAAPAQWQLTAEQRASTVRRVTDSITNVAFSRGVSLSLEDAHRGATAAEKTAYTTAQVESRTTTGTRPAVESLQAYARKLGTLALEYAAKAGSPEATATANDGAAEGFLDLSQGERAFMSGETAEDALEPLLAKGSQITRIKLSTKSFNVEAAKVLGLGIDNVRGSLVDADLSDIIAGRPEDEALAALRTISEAVAAHGRLEGLNLSDNALGEKGVRAFASGLQGQAALQRLAFQNVGASIRACQAIAELVSHSQELRQLHLANNMSDDEGAAAIAELLQRAPLLEDFKMVSSRVGSDGGIALAKGLSTGTGLRRVDLSDNPMTGEAAPALAAMLRRHPRLKAVNLGDTSLGDDGVSAVLGGLQASASSLQEVNLSLNEVTEEGVEALGAFLGAAPHLQRLSLRENELEDGGAVQLAASLTALSSLQDLDLCANQIRGKGAVAITKAVAGLPHLRSLLLDENEISESAIAAIQKILAAEGKSAVLGSLDENDADADDEGDEVEVDGIADRLANTL